MTAYQMGMPGIKDDIEYAVLNAPARAKNLVAKDRRKVKARTY